MCEEAIKTGFYDRKTCKNHKTRPYVGLHHPDLGVQDLYVGVHGGHVGLVYLWEGFSSRRLSLLYCALEVYGC